MGMIRTPAIRVAAIGIALLVLYMLSVFLRPQVVYVDKDTNEIVKDLKTRKAYITPIVLYLWPLP